jgi:hypothetical protein
MTQNPKLGTWEIEEGCWTPVFKWFLVDEGLIQYSFKSNFEAELFKKQGYLSYMLTTDITNIANDTMLDPYEERSWAGEQTTVSLITAT